MRFDDTEGSKPKADDVGVIVVRVVEANDGAN
jgi:hypothetical protein